MTCRGLKAALLITGLGCLLAFPFVFLPWDMLNKLILFFGMEAMPRVSTSMYLLRVTYGIFGLVGIYFLILARDPMRYPALIMLAVCGLFFIGLLTLIAGWVHRVRSFWYLGDPIFAFIMGVVILVLWRCARSRRL